MLNSSNNVNNGYGFGNNCDRYHLGGVLKSIFLPRKFIGSDISRESSIVRTFRNMKENARKKSLKIAQSGGFWEEQMHMERAIIKRLILFIISFLTLFAIDLFMHIMF